MGDISNCRRHAFADAMVLADAGLDDTGMDTSMVIAPEMAASVDSSRDRVNRALADLARRRVTTPNPIS